MNVGMLWFDNSRNEGVRARIERAATYYREKYGRDPNLCFVHPSTYGDQDGDHIGALRVETSTSILPDHFWIGVEERDLEPRAA